jgi:hypothetical protein
VNKAAEDLRDLSGFHLIDWIVLVTYCAATMAIRFFVQTYADDLKDVRNPSALIAIVVIVAACGGGPGKAQSPAQVQPVPPTEAGRYVDVTSSAGIDFINGFVDVLTPPDMAGVASSGAASGDYDNDGDIDLFIVRGDIGPNLLYRNTGNMVFEEVANAAGVAFTESSTTNHTHSGPMFADVDGDGDLDLFLGRPGW